LQSIQLLSAILNYYLLGSASTTKDVTHFWYSQNVRKENLAFSKHGGQTLRNRRRSVTTNHVRRRSSVITCWSASRLKAWPGILSWGWSLFRRHFVKIYNCVCLVICGSLHCAFARLIFTLGPAVWNHCGSCKLNCCSLTIHWVAFFLLQYYSLPDVELSTHNKFVWWITHVKM